MSILNKLGIDRYTARMKQWVRKRMEEIPVEKGVSKGSVNVKGGQNVVGIKGCYYKHIRIFGSRKDQIHVYLSSEQVLPTMSFDTVDADPNVPHSNTLWAIGDIIVLKNELTYYNRFVVNKLGLGLVSLVTIDGSNIPFSKIGGATTPVAWTIFCLDKPSSGIVDLGAYSTSLGFDNLVAGTGATAIGSGNKVYDEYAFAIGYGNKAEEACQARGWENEALGFAAVAEGYRNLAGNSLGGVGAHAEGRNTKAINLCSHSEGERTTAAAHAAHAEGYSSNVYDKDIESLCTLASGIGSHAEGIDTHAHGSASHAEGLCTKAINSGEHACGKYNVSNNDTQFSIGIGTSNTDRKNAIEVTEDGSTYIHGIGGYDGTNANAAKSVQEVIAELQEIVSQITLKVEE